MVSWQKNEYPGIAKLVSRLVWERVTPPSSRKMLCPQFLDTPAIQALPPQAEMVKKTAWPHVWPHLAQNSITKNPGLAQLVARLLWEQDVGSSSLPSRTTAPEIEWFQGLFSLPTTHIPFQQWFLVLVFFPTKFYNVVVLRPMPFLQYKVVILFLTLILSSSPLCRISKAAYKEYIL